MKTAVLLGAGGLGCPAALALAEAQADLRLIIVDPDRVERSNLARQILYGEADLGAPKAEIAARRIGAKARVARFDTATADELLADADVLLDGTDDFPTRFLANDEALRRGTARHHPAGPDGLLALPVRGSARSCAHLRRSRRPRGALRSGRSRDGTRRPGGPARRSRSGRVAPLGCADGDAPSPPPQARSGVRRLRRRGIL